MCISTLTVYLYSIQYNTYCIQLTYYVFNWQYSLIPMHPLCKAQRVSRNFLPRSKVKPSFHVYTYIPMVPGGTTPLPVIILNNTVHMYNFFKISYCCFQSYGTCIHIEYSTRVRNMMNVCMGISMHVDLYSICGIV